MYTSKSASAVAAALALHAHPPLRLAEIEHAALLYHSTAWRGVESLEHLGLITVENAKGYDAYAIDPTSPYRSAIMRATLVDSGIIETLAPLRSKIRFVTAIGSFVWGTPHPQSDIDLLIVGDASVEDIHAALDPVGDRYERHIDVLVMNDREMRARTTANGFMLANVISQGMLLMGGDVMYQPQQVANDVVGYVGHFGLYTSSARRLSHARHVQPAIFRLLISSSKMSYS